MSRDGWGIGLFVLLCAAPQPAAGQSDLGRPPRAPEANIPSQTRAQASLAATLAASTASWFDVSNRTNVQNLYVNVFQPFQNVPYGWNGNVSSCSAGTLSRDYLDASVMRFIFSEG